MPQVVGVLRYKYLFKTRPKALISKPTGRWTQHWHSSRCSYGSSRLHHSSATVCTATLQPTQQASDVRAVLLPCGLGSSTLLPMLWASSALCLVLWEVASACCQRGTWQRLHVQINSPFRGWLITLQFVANPACITPLVWVGPGVQCCGGSCRQCCLCQTQLEGAV